MRRKPVKATLRMSNVMMIDLTITMTFTYEEIVYCVWYMMHFHTVLLPVTRQEVVTLVERFVKMGEVIYLDSEEFQTDVEVEQRVHQLFPEFKRGERI